MQNSSDKILPEEIQCPDCGADLKLSQHERTERKFTCSECEETFVIKDNGMFCPSCKSEFVEGITECPECKVPLVESLPEETEAKYEKEDDIVASSSRLITVYIPKNEADHLAIGSLLRSAGIEYCSKNAGVQNLFGVGQIGTGFNVATGPIQVQVLEDEFESAKEIISSYLSKNVYEIPETCPACNALTQKLPQCPKCGLKFVSNANIEQDEVDESESHQKVTKKAIGSSVSVISGLIFGVFSYLATFNPSIMAPYKFLYELHRSIPISPMIQPTDDTNGDGITDRWIEYSGGKIVKAIFDLNFDGTPDAWEYYDKGLLTSYASDGNFDGNVDRWIYYENGLLSKSEYDRDYDGKPDAWEYYTTSGEIYEVHYDYNFDGRPDLWEVYEKGSPIKYTADNDHDGKVDEWALLEHGTAKERMWSFRNDEIVDKKTVYENGRKVSEAYDRDRDGEFEEMILLDEFERVIKVVNKRVKNQN